MGLLLKDNLFGALKLVILAKCCNSYCSLNDSIVKGHKHFEEETGKTIFKGKVPKFGEAMLTFYAPNKTSYVIPCQTWFLWQPKNRVR